MVDKINYQKDKLYLFFREGQLFRTYPPVDKWFNPDYAIIENKLYDLAVLEDIKNIPTNIKCKLHSSGSGYSGLLFYVLMKKASLLHSDGLHLLSYECMRKAIKICIYSDFSLQQREITQILHWMWEDGNFEEAKLEKEYINNYLIPAIRDMHKKHTKEVIKNALDKSDTNIFRDGLLELSYNPCKKYCSTYASRIYSVDGADTRFPELPDVFFRDYELHENCNCLLSNFIFYNDTEIDHIMYNGEEASNVVEISNRPFVEDDRSPQLIEHDKRLETERINLIRHDENMEIYYKLKHACPEVLPKSLSAFSRMRNSNSAKYQEIKKYASEHGLEI